MGLFSKLFRKRYEKGVTRDNTFFKNYAIKVNGLMRYVEENERVTTALQKLQHDFQFTGPSPSKEAKKIEARIEDQYEALKAALQQTEWDEKAVILMIQNIGMEIDEINAMRK